MICAICLDTLGTQSQQNGGATAIPCGHIFHRNCVKEWIRSAGGGRSCPICRKNIPRNFRFKTIYPTTGDSSESCVKCDELEKKCKKLEQAHHAQFQDLENALRENEMLKWINDEISEASKDTWVKLKVEQDRANSTLSDLTDLQKRYDADVLHGSEAEVFLQLHTERERAAKAEAEVMDLRKLYDKIYFDFEKVKLQLLDEQHHFSEMLKIKAEQEIAAEAKAMVMYEDAEKHYDILLGKFKGLQLQLEAEQLNTSTQAVNAKKQYNLLLNDFQKLKEKYDLLQIASEQKKKQLPDDHAQSLGNNGQDICRNHKAPRSKLTCFPFWYIIGNLIDPRISEFLLLHW